MINDKYIAQHHFELYRTIAKATGIKHKTTDAFESVEALPNAFPNFVFDIQHPDWELLKKQILNKEIPPFLVAEKPVKAIEKFGFRLIRKWPLMGMNTAELLTPPSTDLTLSVVDNKNEVKVWKEIVKEVFNYQFEVSFLEKWMQHPDLELLLGYNKQQPVCTALNFYFDNTVGTHFVATTKNQTKKGFGKYFFYQCIKHALEQHCCFQAICSSTQEGLTHWQKIGFKNYGDYYIYWMMGDV
jgi:hypothetical protein